MRLEVALTRIYINTHEAKDKEVNKISETLFNFSCMLKKMSK